jgi:hypothetical protein
MAVDAQARNISNHVVISGEVLNFSTQADIPVDRADSEV